MKKIKRFVILAICSCLILVSLASGTAVASRQQTVYSAEEMYSDSQEGLWHYLKREVVTDAYEALTYDTENGWWTDGKGGIIAKTFMHSSSDASANHETQIVLQFECPYSGTVDIIDKNGCVSVSKNTDNGVKLWVWSNSTSLYSTVIDSSVDYRVDFDTISTTVKAGDKINFILSFNGNNASDSTTISPVINYTRIDTSVDSSDNENVTENPDTAYKGADGKTVYHFGEMFSSSQSGPWHYLVRENVGNKYSELTFNTETDRWEDSKGGVISRDFVSTTADASATHEMQTCIQFEAPCGGNLTIYSLNGLISLSDKSDNGVRVGIFQNNAMIFNYQQLNAGESFVFEPITVDVTEGDKISFVFVANNGNNAYDIVHFQPVIVYNTELPTLASQITLPKSGTEADGVYNYGDAFDSSQGPVWYYLQREVVSNEYRELTYDSSTGRWADNKGGVMAKTFVHPTADASATHEWQQCIQFVAPSEGNITIYSADGLCSVSPDSDDGIKLAIMQNTNMILNYTTIGKGEKYIFEPITINVDEGDNISFLVGMNKNNASDSTTFNPVIVYNAYEKIIVEADIEVREDDPNQTVYKSYESYGTFVNPWYYKYWKKGAAALNDMSWDTINGGWKNPEESSCLVGEKVMHPSVNSQAVRVFKAPKSGYVDITMLDDVIKLTAETFTEAADGVYVSILLYDGDSTTYLMEREWLYPGDGETLAFEQMKDIHIYKGWEIWFVVNCNINNANDSVQFAPVITYTEITDEEAPVYLNSSETLKENNDYFGVEDNREPQKEEKQDGEATNFQMELGLNLLGILTVIAVFVLIMVIRKIVIRNKGRKKLQEE